MEQKTQTPKVEEKKVVSQKQETVNVNNAPSPVVSTASPSTDNKSETKVNAKPAKPTKKEEAMARGDSIRASKRHCMYICNFIKGKTVDQSIMELEQVVKMKRAIPYKGEVPHRKGAMMSGRYPVNAAKIFITMLKGLKGNILVNGMDLDKTRIVSGVSNWASRPAKRSGGKSKRTHVTLIAKEVAVSQKKEAKK